jgi:hypothetical protein
MFGRLLKTRCVGVLAVAKITSPAGSYLVKWGRLKVSHHFPVYSRGEKTALLLRGSLSISLVKVPVLSTSPKLAKSPS